MEGWPDRKIRTGALSYASDEVRRKVDEMLERAREISFTDTEAGLKITAEAYELAIKNEDIEGQIQAAVHLGRLRERMGHYDQSLLYYSKAAVLSERFKHNFGAAISYIGIGRIYAEMGEYVSAQQNYLKGYEFAGDTSEDLEAAALNNVANTFIDTGEYDKALEYLNKSLTLSRASGGRRSINPVLDSLAEVYLRMHVLDKAMEYAQESVALARGTDPEVGDNLVTLGKIYLAKGEYQQAMNLFVEAAEASEVTRSYRPIIRAWQMIGVAHRLRGRLDESLTALQHAYAVAKNEKTQLFQADCALELTTTYKQAGDYQKALEFYELYHAIRETMFNERSDMRLKTLEVLHQVESARKEAELYQMRASQLQVEIEERLKIETTLEELATRDPLTGIFNRRQFINVGESLLVNTAGEQGRLALILFDIDHFKRINDTFGHIAGDHALRAVAAYIHSIVRRVDVFARLGGDEFAILLPDINADQAVGVADRLRSEVAAIPIDFERHTFHITLSMGVSENAASETSIDPLFARADKGLYCAKQAGRNRVEKFGVSRELAEIAMLAAMVNNT